MSPRSKRSVNCHHRSYQGGRGKRQPLEAIRPGPPIQLCLLLPAWSGESLVLSKPRFPHLQHGHSNPDFSERPAPGTLPKAVPHPSPRLQLQPGPGQTWGRRRNHVSQAGPSLEGSSVPSLGRGLGPAQDRSLPL